MGAARLDPLIPLLAMVRLRDAPILTDVLASANLLVEVRDARIPLLSAAEPLPKRFQAKERIIVLNKTDRASAAATRVWTEFFTRQGETVIAAHATSPGQAISRLRRLLEEKGETKRGRGLVRAAVFGFPNVGKSTLLNALVRAGRAHTGDRPGITVGKQWVKLAPNSYLLDSPGAMPLADKIEMHMPDHAFKLALCRILPDGRMEPIDVARDFTFWLREFGSGATLPAHYAVLLDRSVSPEDALVAIATRLSMLATGGRPDPDAAARRLMVDFAAGKLGRFTLERLSATRQRLASETQP